jgi:hypothetical protein
MLGHTGASTFPESNGKWIRVRWGCRICKLGGWEGDAGQNTLRRKRLRREGEAESEERRSQRKGRRRSSGEGRRESKSKGKRWQNHVNNIIHQKLSITIEKSV